MLRAGIIISKIQTQENISVTDEEVETTIEKLAMQNQTSVAAMKGYISKHGGIERIQSDLLEDKILDFLYAHAQLVEGE